MNFFDVIAPLYDFLAWGKEKTARRIQELSFFSSLDSIADIGGGTGRIAKLIAPKVKEIIVIDASSAMIRQCQKKGLRCIVGDAQKLPFPGEYFDKIIMVDAFHHFQNQRHVLQEIRRVLKKEGTLIIEEFNPKRLGGLYIVLLEKIVCSGSTFYEPEELSALFKKEQFQTSIHESKNKEYYVIAKKALIQS